MVNFVSVFSIFIFSLLIPNLCQLNIIALVVNCYSCGIS